MIKTIIIVDDNQMERDVLKNQLKDQYSILEAENGEQMLQILESGNVNISAILLDLLMPVMDGFEALKKMRKSNEYKDIPVIVISVENDLATREKCIEYGANGYLVKSPTTSLLVKSLDNLILYHENILLVQSLIKDKVTGLMSHELFIQECDKLILSHEPGYYTLSCIDIDHFKVINDQYGMEIGDQVLQHVAECISICYKELDGLACRFTADRFAVLYPTTYANTAVVLENHKKVKNPTCLKHPIQLRIGRFLIQDPSISAMRAYERATVAEETIKGKYDVYIADYDDAMRKRILHEQQIVVDMNDALQKGEFIPFLQPQYNHATGSLIGAEALVRWKKEEGFISPGEFIPIFEKNGFVYEVDKCVWEQVCILLRRWIDEGRKPLPVSVNISRVDLYKEDFFETICGLTQKYQLPTDLLRLEVTESAFSDSPEHIIKMVNKLIQHGFTMEIDDFGSGYSSLNTLKDIPASILKLDMKFFSDTTNGVRSGNIIESVVRMAKWLGMAIIAEGVEKIEQADYLKSIGCYYIQGYLYARPMPVEDYEKLLGDTTHEKKLSGLKTVATLDNGQFWNPESMETLIFNSYVGGACIFEQYKGKLEVLRVNNQYIREIRNILSDEVNLITMNPSNYMDKDNLFLLNQTITEAITSKEETSCELHIINTNQETEYIRYSLRLIATTQERNLIYCVIFNLTEQRTAERRLIEAEQKEYESSQRLRVIMDNVNGGVSAIIFHEDGTSTMVFNNDKYYELYGYTREQAIEEKLDVMKLILPESIDSVTDKIRQLKKDRQPTLIDYAIRKRDGSVALFRASSSIIELSEYGNDVITSVVTDVTELHQLREKAAETADKLDTILNTVEDGISAIAIHGDTFEFIMANDKFYEIHGINRESNPTCIEDALALIHPDDRDMARDIIKCAFGKKEPSVGEYRIIHPDGNIRWIKAIISITKISGIDDPVQVTIFSDITELVESRNCKS